MSKVYVIARFISKKGSESEVRKLLSAIVAPTQSEVGCELYELYDCSSPGKFFFYEIWTSKEDLDKHGMSEHIQNMRSSIKEHLQEPPEVNRINKIGPL